jgi:micrococcal nuclease
MSDKDPYIYRIKSVLKVVDGDTIDASIDLGFDISLEKRIRLAGVDTPESRTTDVNEKKLGLEVKEWLKKKLEGQTDIIVKTELPDSTEKYGRILGHLFIGDKEVSAVNKKKSVNQMMIDDGYAWEYDGGTKKKDFGLLLEKRNENKVSNT